MSSDHVWHPLLADVANLGDVFATRPPGDPPLQGADLHAWRNAVQTLQRHLDIAELRARLLYAEGRPSRPAVKSIIDRARTTRAFSSSLAWVDAFAERRPRARLPAPLDDDVGVSNVTVAGNGGSFVEPAPGMSVLVVVGGVWKLNGTLQQDKRSALFPDGTSVRLRQALYLPSKEVAASRLPVRLDLITLEGAWTVDTAAPSVPTGGTQRWPANTLGHAVVPGFEPLERVAVVQGMFAYFGVVFGPGPRNNTIVARVYKPGPGVADVTVPLKQVVRAPYALHGGLPPPPRRAPDIRGHLVHLTRRDLDGKSSPETLTDAQLDQLIDAWNAMDGPTPRTNTRTVGFDMLEYVRDPTVVRPRPASYENQYGSDRNADVVPVPDDRREEVKHELRKWLGAGVAHVFGFTRKKTKFTEATGVVTGVFIDTDDSLVFVVRYRQTGSVGINYNIVSGRYDIDINTRDIDPAAANVINNYDEIGRGMRANWSFSQNVVQAFAASQAKVRIPNGGSMPFLRRLFPTPNGDSPTVCLRTRPPPIGARTAPCPSMIAPPMGRRKNTIFHPQHFLDPHWGAETSVA